MAESISMVLDLVWEECTVVNVVLVGFIIVMVKELLSPDPSTHTPVNMTPEPVIEKRDYTLEELREFDGTKPSKEHNGRCPIYIAVNGTVFDMTRGKDFYGPGGPYSIFAGRDASRGLAKHELSDDMVKDTWDDISDLSELEMQELQGWFESFTFKYPIRGNLVKSK